MKSRPSHARRRRPFVFLNLAMTADGKIAFDNNRFDPFGSNNDRQRLLLLRSRADAVMSGVNTVGPYRVTLGPGPAPFRRLRLRLGLSEYNLRVVVSGRARLSPAAEIFRHRFSPIIVLTTERAPVAARAALAQAGAHVEVCGKEEVDFVEALHRLRAQWGVRSLLCEGGGTVNDALFRAGLVEELHLTICPWIFGGDNAPTLADGRGRPTLEGAAPLQLRSRRRIGDELYLVYRAKRSFFRNSPATGFSGRAATKSSRSRSTS